MTPEEILKDLRDVHLPEGAGTGPPANFAIGERNPGRYFTWTSSSHSSSDPDAVGVTVNPARMGLNFHATEADHLLDEVHGCEAFVRIWIGEGEAVFDHASAGANGGDTEAVLLGEGFDFFHRNGIWTGKEEFDVVEASLFGEGKAFGEWLVEDEGASSSFSDLAEGDGGAHFFLRAKIQVTECANFKRTR